MAKSEFRLQLEDAIQKRHSKVHPWSDAWVSGRLNRHLLGEWTKQHYHYVSHFSSWLATVFGNCVDEDIRHYLAENIMEEEGFVGDAGFPAVKHTDLLLDFGEHCGMRRQEITDAQVNGELLPETLGLQSWCYRQSHRPPDCSSVSNRRCRRSIAAPRRRSSRNTASPRKRSSSSVSTSLPTKSTASAASRFS